MEKVGSSPSKPISEKGPQHAKKGQQQLCDGFTISAMRKNSVVRGPPLAGAFKERPARPTEFRKHYKRGDFLICLEHDTKGNKIIWKTPFEELDYPYILPLFFGGLCETTFPYDFLARQGIHDMLENGGNKIIPVIPHLIAPIKNALRLRNRQVTCITLKILQQLIDKVGSALIPYFKQILPALSIFKNMNVNSGDGIDYSQLRRENIGDLIQETLEAFECCGGKPAYEMIIRFIPTYGPRILN